MVYKFTNRAKKVIEIANDKSIELGHNYIGTEHILYGLTEEEKTALSSPVEITETVLNEEDQSNETKQNVGSIVTTILIIPFFILIVTMVQMLGAEINDEKTSRGMEIIISSVPAKTHFLSKVVAAISYVLIQGILKNQL